MASATQFEANRLSAAWSCGPNSPEGKARSSGNHRKFGLFSTQNCPARGSCRVQQTVQSPLEAVLAAGAILVAPAVSRGKRTELASLVYLLMTPGVYRLLFVDHRQQIKPAIVLSLLVYGAALTLLPRLMQARRAAG